MFFVGKEREKVENSKMQSLFFLQIEINCRERECPSVGRTQSMLVKGAKAERPQVKFCQNQVREISFSNKLKFSNLHIFATRCRRLI